MSMACNSDDKAMVKTFNKYLFSVRKAYPIQATIFRWKMVEG